MENRPPEHGLLLRGDLGLGFHILHTPDSRLLKIVLPTVWKRMYRRRNIERNAYGSIGIGLCVYAGVCRSGFLGIKNRDTGELA